MSTAPSPEIVHVYVWEVPVRVTHWLIALSIVVLSATGLYIGDPFLIVPGQAREHFVMGWMKVIHGYTAYVFIASVLARVIWMFTGNKYAHWDKFIPVHPSRRRGLWPTLRFYLFALRKPPGFVGHNPLAGRDVHARVRALFRRNHNRTHPARRQCRRRLPGAVVRRARARDRRPAGRPLDSSRDDVAAARVRGSSRLQQHPDVHHRGKRDS